MQKFLTFLFINFYCVDTSKLLVFHVMACGCIHILQPAYIMRMKTGMILYPKLGNKKSLKKRGEKGNILIIRTYIDVKVFLLASRHIKHNLIATLYQIANL